MNRKVNIHVIVNEYLPKILTIRMNMNFGFPNSSWTEYSKNLKKRNSSWIDSNQFEFNSNKRNSGGSANQDDTICFRQIQSFDWKIGRMVVEE